jgi:hypothetical protein
MQTSAPLPSVSWRNTLHGVLLRRVHRVGRAELVCPLELSSVDVDGDDGARTDETRPRDRGVPDAAAAEHRHAVVALHTAGIDRGAEARHHPAAEQAGGLGASGRVHLRRLPGSDQRLVRERADAEGGGERYPVAECHRLLRVVGREAVPGLAPLACAALAAHGAPVEDHEVARCDGGDVGADGFDGAGGLVTEQVREVVADAAFAVVEVGVADTARLHRDERLTRPGVGHDHGLDAHRLPLARRDDAVHLARHTRGR